MEYSFLHTLKINLKKYAGRNAFFIGGQYHTYAEFDRLIRQVYRLLLSVETSRQNCIGVLTEDNLETYAAIMAIWYSGNIFVPLNPAVPVSRNREIVGMSGLKTMLYSGKETPAAFEAEGVASYSLHDLPGPEKELPDAPVSGPEIRYLLFTSGSTGVPKGVPISALNLDSFLSGYMLSGYVLSENDRFLQIYDLSFDGSVSCYTVPLSIGACVYTVPWGSIKYLEAYKLMRDHQLTFVTMPPSAVSYLKPYYREIRLESLRYCLFGGEALYHELVLQWSPCVPNAVIQNIYGPTEATVLCTILNWNPDIGADKIFNGIVSIGHPFGDTRIIVCDPDGKQLQTGTKGELCISGPQVTPGYWNDPQKNKKSFVTRRIDGLERRYYRTGDQVLLNKDGNLLFCGRFDEQVQIQGYRVELSEIEVSAREFLPGSNVVAVAGGSKGKPSSIHLFVEGDPEEIGGLRKFLSSKLPPYMLPNDITCIRQLPKSLGGKISRSELKNMIPGTQGGKADA